MSGAGRHPVAAVLVLAAVASVAGVPAAGPAGIAAADHDPATTNFTFVPLDRADRQPGAEGIRAGTIGASAAGVDVDFETLLELRSVYEAGSWENCGPTSSEVFGIDRDSDNELYEVDEDLSDNVKSFSAGEDEFVAEFNDRDDFGQSTHLNAEDRVLSVIECPNNPETAGWYQVDNSSVTGRTASGEVRTFADPSHYFYVCDCADAAAARQQLGPKPSADPTPTPSPTPTATRTASAGTPTDAGSPGPTATPGPGASATPSSTSGQTATSTPPPTPTPTPADATGADTPSPTPQGWDDYRDTPTVVSGHGFGAGLAVLALAAGAVLAGRRRER